MLDFSFFKNTQYSFEGKKEGEQVILFLHKHWFTIASKLFFVALGLFAPFLVLALAGQLLIAYGLIPLFALLWACYYLYLWYTLFYILTMYAFDCWIVTNLRIIDSIQNGLFNMEESELNIANIQDVSYVVQGMTASMFDYGNVEIQTSAAQDKFIFCQIAHPQKVKDTIIDITTAYHARRDAALSGGKISEVDEK